ncbi:MAG: hypothetical protein Q8868_05030 [Bacteroidota bacterium]|nr:hypothetical protein [Bacteroidota bacterium]
MKTSIILVFSLLIITGPLAGQESKSGRINWESKKRTDSLNHIFNFRKAEPDFNFHIYNDTPFKIESWRHPNRHDSLYKGFPRSKGQEDYVVVETVPRDSRFNDKKFIVKPHTGGEKLKVIKPDTLRKYYLIVVNPSEDQLIKRHQ